jgi:hypothetical protein
MKANRRSVAVLGSTLLVAAVCAQTKTNTFPDSGNVGIGTVAPTAKLDVAYWHGEYSRQLLPSVANGAGTGDAGLYTWISEPGWSWTGAGIGRNIYNSGTWGARVNSSLSAQMIQLREDPTIAFSIWDSSGNGYSPLMLSRSDAYFQGSVCIGASAPTARFEVNLANSAGWSGNLKGLRLLSPDNSYWMDLKTYIVGSGNVGYQFSPNGSPGLVITTPGNVGIGTATPRQPLEIFRNSNPALNIHDGGTAEITIGVNETLVMGQLNTNSSGFRFVVGQDGLAFPGTGSEIVRFASTGNVGIGTTNPTNKLEVNGTIRTKEVIVETTGWSDYVFAPNYRLAPLSEVEAHIQAKGTLPGIPSAAEVAEHGVSVGDMQAKLLAKIEELMLHQIELSKQVNGQAVEIAQLKRENAAFRAK